MANSVTLSTSEAPVEPLPSRTKRSVWRELPFLVVLALALALLIKALLLQAFSIPSGSMQNTLQVGDRVLVNKLVYDFRGIHRGEVVVFNGKDDWGASEGATDKARGTVGGALHGVGTWLGVASDDKDYIKRVIGLPGDRVMCCSAAGNVVVTPSKGTASELHETYLFEASDAEDPAKFFCAAAGIHGETPNPEARAKCPPGAQGLLVPEGRLFVMGDHRGSSADSRYHYDDAHLGTIAISRVVGRAFVVVWPVSHASVLGVPKTFTQAMELPGSQLVLGGLGALPVAMRRRRRTLR